jgi:predicted nucleic acid-binding protein
MIIVLDSNILSFLTNTQSNSEEIIQCQEWFYKLQARSRSFYSSDICDYELRRKLLNIKSPSVQELDELRELIIFLPVSHSDLRKSAEIWSDLRAKGQSNRDSKNIDVDCILSAQCLNLKLDYPGQRVVLATTNVKDFEGLIDCALWQNIE